MFLKVTNEDNSTIVASSTRPSSLEEWKNQSGYYDAFGATASNVDEFVWYEMPDYTFDYVAGSTYGAGATAQTLASWDGTTNGQSAMTGSVVFGSTAFGLAGGIFNNLNIESEDVDVVSIAGEVPSNLSVLLNDHAAETRLSQSSQLVDPRLSPDISVSQLQEVKELEAKNDFEGDDGLGKTQDISFELDDGNQQVATFNSARNTIIDLIAVKNYKDLNLSIIPTTSVESVNATKIQVIDTAGTILSLSSAEFDRMMYAFLRIFYEKYTTVVDMTNTVKNPTGSTEVQQKSFLNNKTNVSFSTSAGTSFVSASLSTSGGK